MDSSSFNPVSANIGDDILSNVCHFPDGGSLTHTPANETDPDRGTEPIPSFDSFLSPVNTDDETDEETDKERPVPVPPFPTWVLPPALRHLADEGAASLGVPAELVGVPALAFAGGVIGNHARLVLKRGYEVRPILWAAVVAPPGSAKTPALALAHEPVSVLQQEADDHGTGDHLYTTDATTEAIAPMVKAAPGLTFTRDELSGWVGSFDAYKKGGKGADRANWLSSWTGAPLRVNRKGDPPITVPKPVVCVVGGIQPDCLRLLADEAGRHDGFVDRILWTMPEVAPSRWTEDEVSDEARAAYLALLHRLRELPPDQEVTLSPAAKAAWVEWHDHNQALLDTVRGLTAGIYSKLPVQVARLALILHCAEHPTDPSGVPLSLDTLRGATELGEYFRAHAHKVMLYFGAEAGEPTGLPSRVLNILRNASDEWTSRTVIHRGLGGGVKATELTAARDLLREKGLIEWRTVRTGKKGHPPEEWQLTGERNESNEGNAVGAA